MDSANLHLLLLARGKVHVRSYSAGRFSGTDGHRGRHYNVFADERTCHQSRLPPSWFWHGGTYRFPDKPGLTNVYKSNRSEFLFERCYLTLKLCDSGPDPNVWVALLLRFHQLGQQFTDVIVAAKPGGRKRRVALTQRKHVCAAVN